jgi:hypothetical protein
MLRIAGDIPGYEEATRALFADDRIRRNSVLRHGPKTSGLILSAWLTQHLNASIRATAEERCIPVGLSAFRTFRPSFPNVPGCRSLSPFPAVG